MWRNWQTRMIQVHVGNHAGSSPVIRTNIAKTTAFFSDFRSFGMVDRPFVGGFSYAFAKN